MAHLLKNKNLEIHIDLPMENYTFSRFDWTGKIVEVKYKNIPLSTIENPNSQNEHSLGKGLYNEFGIDKALGFDEAEIGGWFHKIGVGLLKKEDTEYMFSKAYEIRPGIFEVTAKPNRLCISCKSQTMNGYAYVLRKEIRLYDSSFTIKYHLLNTGEKVIKTNEYVHNFIAINKDLIGSNYILKFPFQLKPAVFGETVNPKKKVVIGLNDVKFNGPPQEQFFFSNLSGSENVNAEWELSNLESNIGFGEKGNFHTSKVNLWGWNHVISPELFFDIAIQPGESTEWIRTYNVYSV
jgi:hypothetical protein